MTRRPSNKKVRDNPAGPRYHRVGAVIAKLLEGGRTLSSLASDAALDRRAIQRIRDGHEAPSPESLGRLCAVISKAEADALISAFIDEVHDRILVSLEKHKAGRSGVV